MTLFFTAAQLLLGLVVCIFSNVDGVYYHPGILFVTTSSCCIPQMTKSSLRNQRRYTEDIFVIDNVTLSLYTGLPFTEMTAVIGCKLKPHKDLRDRIIIMITGIQIRENLYRTTVLVNFMFYPTCQNSVRICGTLGWRLSSVTAMCKTLISPEKNNIAIHGPHLYGMLHGA